MRLQIHTATREESNNWAMLEPESKTESGIVLRAISQGSLEILRQRTNPLSTAEERKNSRRWTCAYWQSFCAWNGTYRLTGGRAVSYTAESSMTYQVLSEHEHFFSCSKRGVRKGYALEATRLANCTMAQEAAEEATAYDASNLNHYTAIQTGEEAAFVPTFDADGKAPDGCKGGLDKCAAFAPQGRAADGAAASQSDRGLGESLDKRAAFARRARSRGAAPSQPIQWSSEYNDSELGLGYYNYRHYNPADGRWTGRDVKGEVTGANLYLYALNSSFFHFDSLGNVFHGVETIPQILNKNGKKLGAQMMEHWFESSGSTVYLDFEYIMQYKRVKKVYEELLNSATNEAAQKIIRERLRDAKPWSRLFPGMPTPESVWKKHVLGRLRRKHGKCSTLCCG